jgi:parallel beta-helix repeat protein
VNTPLVISNQSLIFDNDVIVFDGGVLELFNVSIIMNSTDCQLIWNVTEQGSIIILNSDISAYNNSNPYEFKIYGEALLDNSTFSGIAEKLKGPRWSWYPTRGGIQIYSNDVVVSNNTIENIDYGITCIHSSPLIHNNDILNSEYDGIRCEESNPMISFNRIHSNGQGGINLRNSEPIIHNNIINDSYDGIYNYYSTPIIHNNTISNTTRGIRNWNSDSVIPNNKFYNNKYGVMDSRSSSLIFGNVFGGNHMGIFLSASYSSIENNWIVNGEYGIYCDDSDELEIFKPIIEGNFIHSNNRTGIAYIDSNPKIANNTIGNNSEWGIHGSGENMTHDRNIFIYEGKNNGNGSIFLEYYLVGRVVDMNGQNISDVELTIISENGTQIFIGTLRENRWNPEYHIKLLLPGVILHNNGEIETFEYTMFADKYGNKNSSEIVLDGSKECIISLDVKPDLTVTGIDIGTYLEWVKGNKPNIGSRITISVNVYNNGTSSAYNVSVKTFIDNKMYHQNTVQIVKAKETRTITFKWNISETEHTFEIFVDQDNNITELNESNNHLVSIEEFEKPSINSVPSKNEVDDLTHINTILIVIFTFLVITFIFWIRWRYETWRRD